MAARTEPHFRAHLGIATGALVAALPVGLSAAELGVLAATIGLVLAAELLNTAVEALTDIMHPGDGPRAAAVKDVSAAAVLLASLCAAAVGAFLFLPHLLAASLAVMRGLSLLLAVIFLSAFLAGAVRAAR